jgi:hypothetical protein
MPHVDDGHMGDWYRGVVMCDGLAHPADRPRLRLRRTLPESRAHPRRWGATEQRAWGTARMAGR